MGWLPTSWWAEQPSASAPSADACPVDHKSRQAWLDQARATSATSPPANTTTATAEEACPVDDKARQAWLNQARSATTPAPQPSAPPMPVGESCDSSQIDASNTDTPPIRAALSRFSLDQSREISTIPRAAMPHALSTSKPANNETESGAHGSGNWIYPSEQMFFEAMRRKNFDPQATDMKSIVPIHNAVNERAWKEIKEWEQGRGSEKCGGPKLVSFSGTATALTPKARINELLGYAPPFDRHDWVVDRCGTHVDYVIDFYAGKDEGKSGKSLNFYLDVRPKLNSFEGCKMRMMKAFGL